MLHVSARGEYAVLAVLALSLHRDRRPLQVKSISLSEQIPFRFLEQVMSLLKKAGLLESVRGPHGGYHLTRSPDHISLGEVIQAVEGPLNAGDFSSLRNGSDHAESIVLKEVWADMSGLLEDHLNSISFEELCTRKKEKEEKKVLMFHI